MLPISLNFIHLDWGVPALHMQNRKSLDKSSVLKDANRQFIKEKKIKMVNKHMCEEQSTKM